MDHYFRSQFEEKLSPHSFILKNLKKRFQFTINSFFIRLLLVLACSWFPFRFFSLSLYQSFFYPCFLSSYCYFFVFINYNLLFAITRKLFKKLLYTFMKIHLSTKRSNNNKSLLAKSKIYYIGLKSLLKHRTLALMLSHFLSSNFMTVIFRYLILLSVSLLHCYKSLYQRKRAYLSNRKMKIIFVTLSLMLSPFTIDSMCGRQITRLGKTKDLLCSIITRVISINPYVVGRYILFNFLEFALDFSIILLRVLRFIFVNFFFAQMFPKELLFRLILLVSLIHTKKPSIFHYKKISQVTICYLHIYLTVFFALAYSLPKTMKTVSFILSLLLFGLDSLKITSMCRQEKTSINPYEGRYTISITQQGHFFSPSCVRFEFLLRLFRFLFKLLFSKALLFHLILLVSLMHTKKPFIFNYIKFLITEKPYGKEFDNI